MSTWEKDNVEIEGIVKKLDIKKDDVILYLGGRIDDDNLYPAGYRRYLNSKIEELRPSKIICHNHWYAKKYYEGGILTNRDKIDMIVVQHDYLKSGKLQTINPTDYSDHRAWMKILIDKNPNIVYAMYRCRGIRHAAVPSSVHADTDWFREDYDLNNVEYFIFDRTYNPEDLVETDLGHGTHVRNASDGFAILTGLVKAGFKNINILGFSAFGSDEDMSHHSVYNCGGDKRFVGRKLFNLNTSEDLPAESDILQHLVQTKKIKNLEDYSKLMSSLKGGYEVQLTIKDIFDKIQNTEIQTEPFDHLVIDNLLPDYFYKRLAKELEVEDFRSNYTRGAYGNKERFGADVTDYPAWKSSGGKIPTRPHRRNYEALLSGKSDNIKLFVQLLLKNEKEFYSLLSSKLPTERSQDDYFFHMNMTKDRIGYEIESHCDDEANIYTMLFYAPKTDVNKEFGLHVSRDKCRKERIDFIPNRLIIFAPSKPNAERHPTWHEVKRLSDELVGTRNSFQMFFYKNQR